MVRRAPSRQREPLQDRSLLLPHAVCHKFTASHVGQIVPPPRSRERFRQAYPRVG